MLLLVNPRKINMYALELHRFASPLLNFLKTSCPKILAKNVATIFSSFIFSSFIWEPEIKHFLKIIAQVLGFPHCSGGSWEEIILSSYIQHVNIRFLANHTQSKGKDEK